MGVVLVEGNTTTGSGFVVDSSGYILTNQHVIEGQSELAVVFDDGTRLVARVVGTDAERDIALLRIDASARQLVVLPFASIVREGEDVVALGFPLSNLEELQGQMTVTKGIVSAFRTVGNVVYVQTDTAINSGNSGGPLLNLRGEVVGMNTSSFDAEVAQGIGFAIRYDVLSTHFTIIKTSAFSSPPTPTPTPIVASTQTPQAVFGPMSGSLEHDSEDNPEFNSSADVLDFVAEATFRTPTAIVGDTWAAILWLRQTTPDQYMQGAEFTYRGIVVFRSGHWYLVRPDSADESGTVQSGFSSNFNTGLDDENHVRVVAQGEQGWLFINGSYETELDLSGLMDSGTVVLSASADEGTAPTRFSDFTVHMLGKAYGPRDDAIDHDPSSDKISTHFTRVSLVDGIIEAHFFNPYSVQDGSWSYGFLIRGSSTSEFHAIVVDHLGWWYHDVRTGDDTTQEVGSETSDHINTRASGSNHIRIIALGVEGWLFINDEYVDKLDLSDWVRDGSASAISSYFTGDGIQGKSTRFEEFTIWAIENAK